MADKQNILERYPNWDTTYLFLVDVVSSDIFERRNSANPFIDVQTFSFEDTVRMAEEVSEQFGPWSNHECHEMRNMLTTMDVHNTGRVKISNFITSAPYYSICCLNDCDNVYQHIESRIPSS